MANVKTQKTLYKVGDFVSWQKAGTLVLSPDFQRRPVWKAGAKSYLIDTIVRGLPIPIIFLRDRRIDLNTFEPSREVIDGQQRIRTVLSFVTPSLLPDFDPERDDFTVKKTHNQEMAGKRFSELPADIQRQILEYEFNVHVLPSWVDDREVLQIFRRMNSTNYTLKEQEKRNAHFFGEFKTSMYNLAAEQLHRWREWKTFTENDIARMLEVELTSEFAILMLEGKVLGKAPARINQAYQAYDSEYPERDEIEQRFRIVMDTIEDKLGKYMAHLPLGNRKIIYSLLAIFYDLLFGLDSKLEKATPNSISPEQIAAIKLVGERIATKSVPREVFEASDRRTTNPRERKILFDYLCEQVKGAKAIY